MEPYELVENFEEKWRIVPKGVPLELNTGNYTIFSLFTPVDDLRAYISLTVGPRGGIRETVVAIDPEPQIVADRLVLHSTNGDIDGTGLLLPLTDLRHQVMKERRQRRPHALRLCREAMWDYVEKLTDHPLKAQRLRQLPSTSVSLRGVISAGLPSLGRSDGGAPGHN